MNKEYIRELIDEANEIDAQNDVLMEENRKKRLEEMSKSEEETIAYLNDCSEIELLWATEVLEELFEIFNSGKFVECIEKNTNRCENNDIKEQLKMTLAYIRCIK